MSRSASLPRLLGRAGLERPAGQWREVLRLQRCKPVEPTFRVFFVWSLSPVSRQDRLLPDQRESPSLRESAAVLSAAGSRDPGWVT